MDALLNEAPATPGVTADTVAILLSTFNGAAYVREQLMSLQAQTHGAWVPSRRSREYSADRGRGVYVISADSIVAEWIREPIQLLELVTIGA
jgi:hypothetical protein